ncbi:MAG: FAD-dependent monooxygenase [Alphaproteobacteria bacterium]|nr:FAD-dependent monooxygenase [Alphaproteobacteria bacterium]
MTSNQQIQTEVLIVGGGLVGGLLAALLKTYKIPFVLVDPDTPEHMIDAVRDGRTTAVSHGSKQIFEKAGIWAPYLAEHAQAIHQIRALEKGSVWSVDFNHEDVSPNPMGYIAENMYFRMSILDAIKKEPYCFYNTTIHDIQKHDTHVSARLSDGQQVHAKLLVSAEGRKSPTRGLIGAQMKSRDYAQNALVVHLTHEKEHHHQAWEIFTTEGPFAILPLRDMEQKKSGIVWCRPSTVDWAGCSDHDLEKQIQEIFPYYGRLKIASKRWTFPLSTFHLDKISGHRQVLVGDAAHAMHPIAGQGVNLGWRDVDILADKIKYYYTLGFDVGSDTLCMQYQNARMGDIKTLVKATDILNQLFSNDSKILYGLRNAGFAVVNQLPPLKRFFMRKAMGL